MASAGPYRSLHLAQTDNHASTPPLSVLQARCPSCRPTNSIKALKATKHWRQQIYLLTYLFRCRKSTQWNKLVSSICCRTVKQIKFINQSSSSRENIFLLHGYMLEKFLLLFYCQVQCFQLGLAVLHIVDSSQWACGKNLYFSISHARRHACTHAHTHTHTYTNTHPFNGPSSGTTRVS